ncbi:UDP-N-acetylmuramyl pentapeptide phosphotransferase [Microbacterium sp.]|uniref:UDP-N-acetylmuramyl pentapeptide phosphotransferase n=1 Tax=Microbacterium sp. TaxID=51671 RepID=UPI003A909C36
MATDTGAASQRTGAQAVVADALSRTGSHKKVESDPARRPDVLFRVRHEEGEQISAWWMIGAFVFVSGAAIALLSLIPGGQ